MQVGDKYRIVDTLEAQLDEWYENGDIVEVKRCGSMLGDMVGFLGEGTGQWIDEKDIKNGYVVKSEEDKSVKNVIYCVDDVLAAAKYVSRHNTLLNKGPEEIYKDIIRDIHWCVKKGWGSTRSSGYNIIMSLIDDDTYDCSISVDPNFDTDLVYTMEEVV